MDRDCAAPPDTFCPLNLGALMLAVMALGATAWPQDARALSVTGPLTHSALGQPLNLLFPLRLNADETMNRDCVRAEVLAGEARVPPGLLQYRLESDGEGQVRAVRLLSTVTIDEPIVTVNLSLGCPARFTRQFTAFIDPADSRPTLAQPLALAETVAAVPPSEPGANAAAVTATLRTAAPAEAKPVPVAAASAPMAKTTAPTTSVPQPASKPAPKAKPKTSKPSPAASSVAVAAAEPAPAAKPAPQAPAQPVSRLRMDPVDAPVAPPVVAESASAPASANVADETLVKLQQLEEKLDQVHRENVAAEDQFKLLRAQLDDARNQRYHNVLVYGLGAFLLALAVICAYLWRTRRTEREAHEKAWWAEVDRVRREREESRASAPAPLKAASVSVPPPPGLAPAYRPIPIESRTPMPSAAPVADFDEQTMAAAFVDAEQRNPWPAQPAKADPAQAAQPAVSTFGHLDPAPTAPLPLMNEALSLQFVEASRNGHAAQFSQTTVGVPKLDLLPFSEPDDAAYQSSGRSVILDDENHEVSVEELIDLEQQVDFFQVLGQDDAAADLLRQRIAGGQASALPYLKLLELHQRRGEEAEFNALTEQFTERFKTVPPTWGAKLDEGRDLESYTRVLEFIQQHWADSGASMAVLQNLLSHGGVDAQGFDLPAYRDLLLLYALARDQSEREVRGQEIDLFLPLDAPGGSRSNAMMATIPNQAVPQNVMLDLHLDIDLDQPVPPPAG